MVHVEPDPLVIHLGHLEAAPIQDGNTFQCGEHFKRKQLPTSQFHGCRYTSPSRLFEVYNYAWVSNHSGFESSGAPL